MWTWWATRWLYLINIDVHQWCRLWIDEGNWIFWPLVLLSCLTNFSPDVNVICYSPTCQESPILRLWLCIFPYGIFFPWYVWGAICSSFKFWLRCPFPIGSSPLGDASRPHLAAQLNLWPWDPPCPPNCVLLFLPCIGYGLLTQCILLIFSIYSLWSVASISSLCFYSQVEEHIHIMKTRNFVVDFNHGCVPNAYYRAWLSLTHTHTHTHKTYKSNSVHVHSMNTQKLYSLHESGSTHSLKKKSTWTW